MRKILLFLLAAVMVLSLAACGEGNESDNSTTKSSESIPASSTQSQTEASSSPESSTAPSRSVQGDTVALIKSGQTRDVPFGGYKWRILTVEGGKALLLAEDLLANHEFQDGLKFQSKDESTHYRWDYSALRTYLNEAFLDTINAGEQALIVVTHIVTPDNPQFGTEGGNDTDDKIFALSIGEVEKYLPTAADKKARDSIPGVKTRAWWLRSPGATMMSAVAVTDVIGINGGNDVAGGVRPALWLNLQ
jgi:hypothetical protein